MPRQFSPEIAFGPRLEALEPRLLLSAASESLLIAPAASPEFYYNEDMLLDDVPAASGYTPTNPPNRHVHLIVRTGLTSQIPAALATYQAGLEADGFTVSMEDIANATGYWNIKSHIQDVRVQHPDLDGVVFIGTFTSLPRYEVEWWDDEDEEWKYDSGICDLYFMDLDGVWNDTDDNGIFDEHPTDGNQGPDIWVSRILPGMVGDEVELANRYFAKLHDYRTGALTFAERGIQYIDDDWSAEHEQALERLELLYPGAATVIWEPFTTTADDLKDRLDGTSYEFLHNCAHAGPTGFGYLAGRDAEDKGIPAGHIDAWELPGLNWKVGFHQWFHCSFAKYDVEGFGAGQYIFNTDYGIAGIGSTVTGSMWGTDVHYGALALGATMGETLEQVLDYLGQDGYSVNEMNWNMGLTCIGDGAAAPTYTSPLIPLPDLRDWSQSFSDFSPKTVAPRQPWSCSWGVYNGGDAAAVTAFDVDVYASDDSDIDPDEDHYLGTMTFGPLAAGQGAVETLNLSHFPDLDEGYYFVGVVIDAGNDVGESIEDNNTSFNDSWLLKVEYPPQPDLVSDLEAYHSFAPQTVYYGQPWDCTWRIHNAGDATVTDNFSVLYFASTNQVITPGSDILLGSSQVTMDIPAGAPVYTALHDPTFSNSVPKGEYYVGVYIDYFDNVDEADEGNNTGVKTAYKLNVAGDPLPDLVDAGDEFSTFWPGQLHVGDQWHAQWRVLNQGNLPAGTFKASVYVSEDEVIGGGDDAWLAMASAPGLGVGETVDLEFYRDEWPTWVGDGLYYIYMRIDTTDDVAELDEDNNDSFDLDTYPMAVGDWPDLAPLAGPSSVFDPQVVWPGDAWDASCPVRNYGPVGAATFGVAFFLSEDTEFDIADDYYLGGEWVTGGLASETTTVVTAHVDHIPNVDPGDYYLFVIADPSGAIAESDEQNNAAYDYDTYPLRVMGPTPDLRPAAGSTAAFTPTSVTPGQPWGASWRVKNEGDGEAFAFHVDYYASTDQTIDPSEDYHLGGAWVQHCYGGLDAVANMHVDAFPAVPAGSYYVGIVADRDDAIFERDETNNAAVAEQYPLTVTWSGSGSIDGVKFNDLNENGQRDPDEPPLSGWTIYLDQNRNGVKDPNEPSRVTDGSGQYHFGGLPEGEFYVAEEPQAGWIQTHPTSRQPDGRIYVAATQADDTVKILDGDFQTTASFPAGEPDPRAIAADGTLIYTVHSGVNTVVVYNTSGTEVNRWVNSNVLGAWGMDLVDGDLAVARTIVSGGYIVYFNPANGAFLRSYGAAERDVAALAYDGQNLWQLSPSTVYKTDPADGSVLDSFPAPAACDGMTVSGIGELALAADSGQWYRVLMASGTIVETGASAADIHGLKLFPHTGTGSPEFLIDFDDNYAPPVFRGARALRDAYAPWGVHFDSKTYWATPLDGGAILDESGEFGVTGYSGSNFLAFSNSPTAAMVDGGMPAAAEEITFDFPVSYVEAKVGSECAGDVVIEVYGARNWPLGTVTIELTPAMQTFTLQSSLGISRLVLTSDVRTMVLDDLGFSGGAPTGGHAVVLSYGEDASDRDFGNYEGGLPDLAQDVDEMSWYYPTTVSPGDYFELYWQFVNNGPGDAGPFHVTYHLSVDENIDLTDPLLAVEDFVGLGSGGVTGSELYIDSFPGVSWGEYYVGVIIDRYDAVVETDETNNTGVDYTCYPLTVLGPNLPDLKHPPGSTSDFSSPDANIGQPWSAWWDVKNTGDAAAEPFDVDFYAAPDIEWSPDYAEYLGTARVGGLDSLETASVRLDLASFPSIPEGDYYIAIEIDPGDEVVEINELNLWLDDSQMITVADVPMPADLVAGPDGTTGFTPTTVDAGDYWESWWGVVNTGGTDAGGFDVAFYASIDTEIDGYDFFLGSASVSGVAAGGSASAALALTDFPGYVPAGNYYVGAVIDPGDDVPESNETNNAGVDLNPYPLTVTTPTYDFGDAPSPYPTLLADDGARHLLGAGPWLGDAVDDEPDGQPNADATGDGADEDGVVFLDPLVPGESADIQVICSGFGSLDAWIDFGDDGSWADAGDHVVVSNFLTPGTYTLTVNVPPEAVTGETFARFRVSSTSGLGFTGLAGAGEVEDYAVDIVNMDYGDAPDPYFPTLADHDGARHMLGSGLYLGAGVDADADGQPNADATGDDADGNDDEDGVVFLTALEPGELAELEVTVSASGVLQVWIDVYRYGSWDDLVDHVITDHFLTPGVNTVSFTVPAGAVEGPTFARFRLSSQTGLTDTGLADDGEVEDYQVLVGPGGSISGAKWHDQDGNRARDPGDSGLWGWTIFLDDNANGTLDPGERSTTTDANGDYVFDDLPPGTYLVDEVMQDTAWAKLSPVAGGHTVALLAGQVVTGIDFGNAVKGDCTGDAAVDYLDLGILATYYDQTGMDWTRGDFTDDGAVNYMDLGILATYYDYVYSPPSGPAGGSSGEPAGGTPVRVDAGNSGAALAAAASSSGPAAAGLVAHLPWADLSAVAWRADVPLAGDAPAGRAVLPAAPAAPARADLDDVLDLLAGPGLSVLPAAII